MTRSSDSHLERRFESLWYSIAPDLPLTQQRAGIVPKRRYVYDFCFEPAKVLFEIQGGTYARGRSGHSSGAGIARDADKVNKGQLLGYTVFVLPVDHLTKEYVSILVNYCRQAVSSNT